MTAYRAAKPYLDDGDLVLYHGDVLTVLQGLPDGIAQTCVTSPPYWGLRSYLEDGHEDKPHELGLEATPDLYIARMVEVFREVRRVLRDDATLWLNIGDSYASNISGGMNGSTLTKGGQQTPHNRVERGRPDVKPKDLVGIPWRLALALQADGWYLRSDIIWAKPNPMPESVTDRPTKSHEYVFLFSKQPRYFWDQDAVREPLLESSIERGRYGHSSFGKGQFNGSPTDERHQDGKDVRLVADLQNPAGRNLRSVWQIATQPFPEAHFATYPEELVRRCILAGTSERGECVECGAPWRRQTQTEYDWYREPKERGFRDTAGYMGKQGHARKQVETTGWEPSCSCRYGKPSGHVGPIVDTPFPTKPQLVLDPFVGSGTTALVARKHGRHSIGIDLSADYLEIAARRTQQLSLLGGAA